jgi:flagellar biogenesis protein FliO
MPDDYDNIHHMRRDVHDAHASSQVAKVLSTLALLGAILSLGMAIWALDKAGQAQSDANRANDAVQRVQSQ